ncbi:7101_t:CDS:2 [Ambispora leptoticha]|uniref:7101_t:CDS:1 n=1 Tax=Ambispora leptoticha TaxID=144679 RepID=A0A9N9B572_9GLOM|nr:7101_t:CDS:2 [Ambispora leptoticha]
MQKRYFPNPIVIMCGSAQKWAKIKNLSSTSKKSKDIKQDDEKIKFKYHYWTNQEIEKLKIFSLFNKHDADWQDRYLREHFPNRTVRAVKKKCWQLKYGNDTLLPEDIQKLHEAVKKFGFKWSIISRRCFDSKVQPIYLEKFYRKENKKHGNTKTEHQKSAKVQTLENSSKYITQKNGFVTASQKIEEPFCKNQSSVLEKIIRDIKSGIEHLNTGPWHPDEQMDFEHAYKRYGQNWDLISEAIGSRSKDQCEDYWRSSFIKQNFFIKN